MHFCTKGQIVSYIDNVTLDYLFENDKVEVALPDYTTSSRFIVRRIVDYRVGGFVAVIPLCLRNPIRSELEIDHYRRDYLESIDNATGRRTVSLLLLTFIDGFGLYRNAYRSLIGFYYILAGMNQYKRVRRANVFLVTLGPHGSNFADVVKAIREKGLKALDRGVEIDVDRERVLLIAFTYAYLGDMPQQ